MEKKKCEKCNKEIKFGAFAYKQNVCRDCFKDIILNMLTKLDGEEREVIVFTVKALAEIYGEEF